ncbi:MAG: BON domain-containing protein [Gammaproteobacteria bacterium]|nr:BON domain-containing protein [Gammaproteobacteria bacterium]
MQNLIRSVGLMMMVALACGCAGYQRDAEQRTVGEWTDDAAILSVVKTRLVADPLVKGLSISAQVNRGVVTLFGSVATPEEKAQAIDIARGVRGVTDVVDRIVLVSSDQ